MIRPFDSTQSNQYPAAIGVDEVGRGCLSACLIVSAAWFDPSKIPPDLLGALDDSKRLSHKRRIELAVEIKTHCEVAFAASSPRVIELLNIRGATLDAMRRAVECLNARGIGEGSHIYIDGRDVPQGLNRAATAVVKGDKTIPQIAAASIVAKVLRDNLLIKLDKRHPLYGWAQNASYGTPAHIAAIRLYGATPHHRKSFVASALSK